MGLLSKSAVFSMALDRSRKGECSRIPSSVLENPCDGKSSRSSTVDADFNDFVSPLLSIETAALYPSPIPNSWWKILPIFAWGINSFSFALSLDGSKLARRNSHADFFPYLVDSSRFSGIALITIYYLILCSDNQKISQSSIISFNKDAAASRLLRLSSQ
jgi:hypothetical protein